MALPTTIDGTAALWPIDTNTFFGPFIHDGNVYVITKGASGGFEKLRAYKATDPTSSFTEQDTADRPNIGSSNSGQALSAFYEKWSI